MQKARPPCSGPQAQVAVHGLLKTQAHTSKPFAKRWEYRYSAESLSQSPSPLKESAKTLDPGNTIPLGTGRPAAQYFPWQSMTMCGTTTTGTTHTSPGQSMLMSCMKGETTFDLSSALNYGYSAGSPQLIRYFTDHVKSLHAPVYQDWETCLTCGTTAAMEIVFRMFCNRGDWILAETFTYSGMATAAKAQGLNILGINMDHHGLIPEDLDEKLQLWDTAQGLKPFVLYMIPTGQNPTGTTQSTKRRKAIYEVAEKHDLYIIEDDPYYFLHLENVDSEPDQFKMALPTSYLSLDVSGRVLRLDTASKILAPGLRFGWITGPAQLIDLYVAYTEVSTLSPSGPSQVMMYKLLNESWGHRGFLDWLVYLSSQYRQRRNLIIDACMKHLPSRICQWTTPKMGMFLWIRIDLSEHPSVCSRNFENEGKQHLERFEDAIENRIYSKAENNGVQVGKGSWFALEKSSSEIFFRLTFAAAAQADLELAVIRFSEVLQTEFEL